jgi:CHASE2 domain-containing sensor protein
MGKDKGNNDLWAEWLIIIPCALLGCAILWSHHGPLWGLSTGLVILGLSYYYLIYKKKS